MRIAVITFRLHAPWVHSLKEKRMIVKSIVAKLQSGAILIPLRFMLMSRCRAIRPVA